MPHGYTSISNHPERSLFTAIGARQRCCPLGRPMTEAERIAIALCSARPSHMLTWHKPVDDRTWKSLWPVVVKRINRGRDRRDRLTYFGSRACSVTYAADHIHVLLWDFLWAPMLHKIARQMELGNPDLLRIPSEPVFATAQVVSYVVGQRTPVFGTKHHLRHEPRSRNERRWFWPQRRTLAKHRPELLAAIENAKCTSLGDSALIQRCLGLETTTTRSSK